MSREVKFSCTVTSILLLVLKNKGCSSQCKNNSAFVLQDGPFLLLYEQFVMNRWWFHSDVKLFGLQSSDPSSLGLSHILSRPVSSPRLLFHPLISPSGPSTNLQNKRTLPTSKRLWCVLLFNPCVRLLLVQCQHLRALSISIAGLIWSLDLKETSSPLLSFALLRISCNPLFVLDYVLCAILRSLLVHLCDGMVV